MLDSRKVSTKLSLSFMIELFASIATILGFTLEVSDRIRDRESRVVFTGLLAISSTSKAWKTLHTRYHPLNRQVQSVVGEISIYQDGRYIPRSVGDIAANRLRVLFFDGILNDAVINFRNNTRREIRDIRASLDNGNISFQTKIEEIRRLDADLASELVELSDLRVDALLIHDRFLNYLDSLSNFIGEPNWNENHVRFILDNRNLLNLDLQQMINLTDRVLMTFLDIYIIMVQRYALPNH
jgi:hypothetical protein